MPAHTLPDGRGMKKPGFPGFATRKKGQVGCVSKPGQMTREPGEAACYTHRVTPTGNARAAGPVAAAPRRVIGGGRGGIR